VSGAVFEVKPRTALTAGGALRQVRIMQKTTRGAWAVAASLILTPAVAIGGGLGLAPLQAAAGLIGAPWLRLQLQARRAWPFLALLFAFGGWVAASALWSPDPGNQQGLRLLGGIACGVLFVAASNGSASSRRLVRAAALTAAIMLAGFALIEANYGMPLNRLDQPDANPVALMRNPGRGVGILVMLFWAAFGGWASGGGTVRAIAWVLAPIVVWLSFGFDIAVNFVAFAAGSIAFAFGMLAPRFAIQTIAAALAAWLIAAPWIVPNLLTRLHAYLPSLPDSWAIRVEIWRFVSARIAEHPWIGMGLDASHRFAGQTRLTQGVAHEIVPLHPHNAALHIWLDTGLVGAGLAAAALVVGGWTAARALQEHRSAIASACGAIAVVGVLWNVSFGAWQEWMVASAFASAALVTASRRGSA
jgi:O-antigen ligase